MENTAIALDRFSRRLGAYEMWRSELAEAIDNYRSWFERDGEQDSDEELRIFELLDTLKEDKLTVALVGEFSRGKSELINAIFFADYKRRLLPSTPGRTTMCPTEILYDSKREPCIRLLPIETRKSAPTVQDQKKSTVHWTSIPLNIESAEEMAASLQELIKTKKVSAKEARELGFISATDQDPVKPASGIIEIPVWRHAVINYPHKLLKQGLVILDTPGLNALGSEPELTLNMLPSAHAVLFVLAADTGVTSSDMKIWQNYVCAATYTNTESRIATLNKIDTLWDELLDEAQIRKSIDQQIDIVAKRLNISHSSVFPISAHKGLLGKIRNNSELIYRSGLLKLEEKLSVDIVAYKKELLRGKIVREIGSMVTASRNILLGQIEEARNEQEELLQLRGKNKEVINGMIQKLTKQKEIYNKEVSSFYATRQMLLDEVKKLLGLLSVSRFDQLIHRTRKSLQDSWTTQGIRAGMADMFELASETLAGVESQSGKVRELVDNIYHRFHEDHGLPRLKPVRFSVESYTRQFAVLEREAEAFRKSARLVMTEQHFIVRNFFITIASRARSIFSDCNSATRTWSKSIMSPIYTQIQEHRVMIDRRLDNLENMKVNTASLETRLSESRARMDDLRKRLALVDGILKKLYENPGGRSRTGQSESNQQEAAG